MRVVRAGRLARRRTKPQDPVPARVQLWGRDSTFWGMDSVDGLHEVIGSWVETTAEDLEGDRWISGDGWREYEGAADT